MWQRTSEGWLLKISVDPSNTSEAVLWADDHLKLFLSREDGHAIYRLRVDRRRTYHEIVGPRWISLVFGQSDRIRPHIKGRRLWRDRQIVLQCYGRRPRSYFAVAR